jgi:site-specific DNA recombinase
LNRKRAVLQDQATWEGVDLAKVKKDIAEIGKAALCLDELITRERNHSIRGGVIEQVRREWWDRRDVAEFTESEEKALAEWPGYWAGLGIERQREMCTPCSLPRSTLVECQRNGSTSPGRVRPPPVS